MPLTTVKLRMKTTLNKEQSAIIKQRISSNPLEFPLHE